MATGDVHATFSFAFTIPDIEYSIAVAGQLLGPLSSPIITGNLTHPQITGQVKVNQLGGNVIATPVQGTIKSP